MNRRLTISLLMSGAAALIASLSRSARGQVVATPRGLRVDGRPMFPVGIYYAPSEKLAQMREMGFTIAHVWALPGKMPLRTPST